MTPDIAFTIGWGFVQLFLIPVPFIIVIMVVKWLLVYKD